uniref:3-hydroxyisobutyryl-CoA hydrolase n=2 Tax=Solanum lycopersicum TaxID=4081 RepID=A0A3Q7EK95_SOLLC
MISCGLATHYSHSAKIPLIEEQLGTLITDDPSVIERSLENWGEIVHPEPESILHRIETLDKCFSHDTVEEIIDALESEAAKQDAWCVATLRKLQETSPLSLKVSLRSIREGRHQTLDQCLRREYRMSVQALSGQITSDFREGVRARLVDRDLAPKWDPPTLEKVTDDMVDQYFSRLTAFEPELELPTQQREAFT